MRGERGDCGCCGGSVNERLVVYTHLHVSLVSVYLCVIHLESSQRSHLVVADPGLCFRFCHSGELSLCCNSHRRGLRVERLPPNLQHSSFPSLHPQCLSMYAEGLTTPATSARTFFPALLRYLRYCASLLRYSHQCYRPSHTHKIETSFLVNTTAVAVCTAVVVIDSSFHLTITGPSSLPHPLPPTKSRRRISAFCVHEQISTSIETIHAYHGGVDPLCLDQSCHPPFCRYSSIACFEPPLPLHLLGCAGECFARKK